MTSGNGANAKCRRVRYISVLAIDHFAQLTMPEAERRISFWATFPRNFGRAVALWIRTIGDRPLLARSGRS